MAGHEGGYFGHRRPAVTPVTPEDPVAIGGRDDPVNVGYQLQRIPGHKGVETNLRLVYSLSLGRMPESNILETALGAPLVQP